MQASQSSTFSTEAEQKQRHLFSLIETYADPSTQRHLDALGLRDGSRCLEVGCGGGSIARWLGRRVGPTGHVLAVDIDTRFMPDTAAPNLEVRELDISTCPLQTGAFDLIHARSLLHHVPHPEQVLERLVAALAPGGRLLLEEPELFPLHEAPSLALRRAFAVIGTVLRARGADVTIARKIPAMLDRFGLVRIGTDVTCSLSTGGSPVVESIALAFERIREQVVAAGLISDTDAGAALALARDPSLWLFGPAMVAVWGTRP